MDTEQESELERAERLADREKWLDILRTSAECFAWCAAGLACMAWSFHTSDAGYGIIAFRGGLVIGNAGILFALYRAQRRSEARGDTI
jgi:hypothetical protein